MASARDVMNAIKAQLDTSLGAVAGLVFQTAVGWPTRPTLEQIVQQQQKVLACVYERMPGTFRRERAPFPKPIGEVTPAPLVTVNPTATQAVPPDGGVGTVSITIGGSIQVGDAVVLGIQIGKTFYAASATAIQGDTLSVLAARLASDYTGQALGLSLTVTAVGAVIQLKNTASSGNSFLVIARTGNIGTRWQEWGREYRSLQVQVWCPTEAIRQSATDPLVRDLVKTTAAYGLQLGSSGSATAAPNEWVRVDFRGDWYDEGQQLRDVYERGILLECEHSIIEQVPIYPVLAFLPTQIVSENQTQQGAFQSTSLDVTV